MILMLIGLDGLAIEAPFAGVLGFIAIGKNVVFADLVAIHMGHRARARLLALAAFTHIVLAGIGHFNLLLLPVASPDQHPWTMMVPGNHSRIARFQGSIL